VYSLPSMSRTRITPPAIVQVPSTIVPQVFSEGGSTVTQNRRGLALLRKRKRL
jgi:hypothetical protein